TCRKTKRGFSIKGIFGRYDNLKIRLLGEHQLINAATAVGLVEALRFFKVKIDYSSIKKGFAEAVWPGRCEVVSRKPLVVLDGAQNSASIKALKEAIKNNFEYKKLILILGISSDKDISGICRQLNGWVNQAILTRAKSSRAESPQALAQHFTTNIHSCISGVREALQRALKMAQVKDLILVTGSLFVVGEARDFFSGNSR
ncbi:MAG TPA: bifunctional folylpolyglutamate synthase/dihydrofolate synthase, partial [Candidatus Omnitrophica bacterium]|nr:bifunctional folylpolyglutamate synthase/dihydrofolate synthase [Candidatus Omnitrophota bacterium]